MPISLEVLRTYSAFADTHKIGTGGIREVAEKTKAFQLKDPKATLLIFDDFTGKTIELDLRGNMNTVLHRVAEAYPEPNAEDEKKIGPGRPKLGVISREVTLLPQHWDWLASQAGGASVTLRKLVEEAKRKNLSKDRIRQSQEAAYRFMTIMAGNLPHFEDALRAIYAKERDAFLKWMKSWEKDIRDPVVKLSKEAFLEDTPTSTNSDRV